MKRLKHIFTLLICLVGITSCNSFLEVDIIGKSDTSTFFAELDGLRAAMTGAYRVTYNFYDGEFIKYGDVAGNMVRMSNVAGGNMIDQYNFTSEPSQETSAVGYLWKRGFIVMTNVNNILDFAGGLREKHPHNTTEIDLIIAQAHFLRALMHFNLVLCYAQPYNYTSDASHWGIPVLTQNPSANDPVIRSTVKQTYEQVIRDINSAMKIFETNSIPDPHYAGSKETCKALLARVYLYMGEWEKAEKEATYVIGKYKLTPRDKYINMYSENYMGEEAIFRLAAFDAGKQTGSFYKYGSAIAFPADTLYSLYTDERDIRKSLLYYRPQTKTGKVNMKFFLRDTSDPLKGVDHFVLRASEMYLIRAEAYMQMNQLDKAIEDIKVLEARALGITPAEVVFDYNSKEDVDRIIEIERIKELAFEGHRFFDIARQNKNIVREKATNSNVRQLNYPDYRFALPIPLVEKEANPQIQQNEGY